MSEFRLISLTGSSALWCLRPRWGMHEARRVRRESLRDRTGGLHTLTWGGWYEATVPLHLAGGALADALQQWWREQARLAWTVESSDGAETAIVRVADPVAPLGRRERGQPQRRRGTVRLAGIGRDGDRVRGAPLILDHQRFGALDADNVLL